MIQILNRDREVVDEALYAGSNIGQALYDYHLAKASMIKTTGLLPEDGKLDKIKLIKTEYNSSKQNI